MTDLWRELPIDTPRVVKLQHGRYRLAEVLAAAEVQGLIVPVEPTDRICVDSDDLRELAEWAEICDHVDHHGYCQTHGLGEVDEDRLCGIGRLVAALENQHE